MRRGFTLIEVIVVMAIVSILAGIMIPFVYRVWESSDIEITKERMTALKKAIVGDPSMTLNGTRTQFGYVGDCGILPLNLLYLIEIDQNCSNWDGPYLSPGFNSSEYNKDAWGEEIIYDYTLAKLTSKGPDRVQGTGDDIQLQIAPNEINEAKPVRILKGNMNFSIYNRTSNPVTPLFYSKAIELLYNQGTNCMALNTGTINPGETKHIVQAFSFSLNNFLTKGKIITARGSLFTDSSCSTVVTSTDINLFVSSVSEELFINIPISYSIQ